MRLNMSKNVDQKDSSYLITFLVNLLDFQVKLTV